MTATAFRPVEGAEPISNYRLERLLGKGGFGEVWRARAPGGFPVALKFLAADTAASERELRSLQMLQRIRDGHLLSLFGVWRIPGFFLLAMELADSTLLDRLNTCQHQGLPGVARAELLDWFQQAARGLDFLNEAQHVLVEGGRPVGIQHGDVKPQNLLLVGSLCKVGDFGLLRQLAVTTPQKTNSMTAAYAPPEVFGGHSSAHSDQYSLAVSWCQLRGGRLPFEGPALQIMAGHLYRPPDLSMLPQAEQAAVARALSKPPQERWPSCRQFVEALRATSAEVVPARRDNAEQFLPTIASASVPTISTPGADVPRGRGPLLSLLLVLLLGGTAAFLGLGGLFSDEGEERTDSAGQLPQQSGEKPQPGKPFINKVGMKFAWIEPGTFLMGSPDGTVPVGVPAEQERNKDEIPHKVTLTKGYHLGVHLVTQAQWETVMGKDANHSIFKGTDDDEKKKLPVDNVSWFDSVDFCIKLSEREARKPHYRLTNVSPNVDGSLKAAQVEIVAGGTGYRLPTEAEWEYACRAGTTTPFWWGATITTDQANYDGNYLYGKNGKTGAYRKKTTPVDEFKANPWGLRDMHGNLYQWCQDRYGTYPKEYIKDPQGPNKGGPRILRGGSWFTNPWRCRSAYRYKHAPGDCRGSHGCRLLLRLD